jgi:hypothetical protein
VRLKWLIFLFFSLTFICKDFKCLSNVVILFSIAMVVGGGPIVDFLRRFVLC